LKLAHNLAILKGRFVKPPFGKFSFGCVALGLALACDPHVTIGSKWRPIEGGGGSADSGGTTNTSAGTDVGGAAVGGSTGGVPSNEAGQAGQAAEPTLGGAGGAPDDGILFLADHESGNLVEWDEGPDSDAGGYYADTGVPMPAYSEDVAHSGSGSAKIVINTDAPTDVISRLYRRIEQPDAYYRSWFYLAEDHTPNSWWSIFLFRAVKDRNASIDLWSVNLVRTSDNKLTVALFDHQYDNGNNTKGRTINVTGTAPIVPVKQWFQLQASLHVAEGAPSQLTVWLDGVEVLKLADTTAAPAKQPLYWVIGNGGGKMSPTTSTVYVDDAEIAKAFSLP
jgi:hypothetical protein